MARFSRSSQALNLVETDMMAMTYAIEKKKKKNQQLLTSKNVRLVI